MKNIYIFQFLIVLLALGSFAGSARASSEDSASVGTTISGDYVGALFRQQGQNSSLANGGANALKGIPANVASGLVNSGVSSVNPSFLQNAAGNFGAPSSSGGGIGDILGQLLGGLSDPLEALKGFFGQQFAQIIAGGFVNADAGDLLGNSNFTGALSGVVDSVSNILNGGALSGDLGNVAADIGKLGAAPQSVASIASIKAPSVTASSLTPLKAESIPLPVRKDVPAPVDYSVQPILTGVDPYAQNPVYY